MNPTTTIDGVIAILNAALLGLLAVAAGWAALSPRICERVLCKAGLMIVALGTSGMAVLLGSDAPGVLVGRAALVFHVGLIVMLADWCLRRRGARHKMRRVTDWGWLDDRVERL